MTARKTGKQGMRPIQSHISSRRLPRHHQPWLANPQFIHHEDAHLSTPPRTARTRTPPAATARCRSTQSRRTPSHPLSQSAALATAAVTMSRLTILASQSCMSNHSDVTRQITLVHSRLLQHQLQIVSHIVLLLHAHPRKGKMIAVPAAEVSAPRSVVVTILSFPPLTQHGVLARVTLPRPLAVDAPV